MGLARKILPVFLAIARVPFDPFAWVFFPLVLVLLLLFNIGGAFLTSAISVYFKDFPFIIESGLRVLFFATPIFYSPDFVPERFRDIYLLNPLASAITSFRQILMEGKIPDPSLLLILASVSLVVLILGWLVFRKLEGGFAEEV